MADLCLKTSLANSGHIWAHRAYGCMRPIRPHYYYYQYIEVSTDYIETNKHTHHHVSPTLEAALQMERHMDRCPLLPQAYSQLYIPPTSRQRKLYNMCNA